MLPVVVALSGQPVLVVGAGKVAAAKIKLLLAEGARVTVIASEVLEPVPESVRLIVRPYRPGDLHGYRVAVVAVGDAATNAAIRSEADSRGTWLNVVDTPQLCDFFFTAVHREGDVVVSVSTEGAAPALAQLIRDHLSESLPPGIGAVATTLRERRDAIHQSGESTESTRWKDVVTAHFHSYLAARSVEVPGDL